MKKLETIKVTFLYGKGGSGQINKEDFDEAKHEIYKEPVKKKTTKK